MAETYVSRSGLQVADRLARFIEDDVLPGLPVSPEQFWTGAAGIFAQYAPENAALLAERDRLQSEIDRWHLEHKGEEPFDQAAYQAFLTRIGYLVDEPAPFTISPGAVDAEIAERAGPQLVVPVSNARFLLNAANARWGSLYDALYGTDAIAGERGSAGYDPERGAQVIAWGRNFLDSSIPLASGSWADWQGDAPVLADPSCLVGRAGANYLFRHNGLHIELVIDANHPIGRTDKAHIADIVLESALTTIADLEDSVAAVDAEDKVGSYANWLGLMRGDLTASFTKGGTLQTRSLAGDRHYTDLDGKDFSLSGRSLMFVRNVGHLMTTPAVLLESGAEAPEGILDAIVTSLIALHDRAEGKAHRNSAHGSVYIVKPKMHGPAEVAFANSLFDAVEDMLSLPRHTVKLGLMDEERRTSANLAACIHAVKGRLVFINTGFLDRTGDEIHTSMQAGPMVRKGAMKASRWIAAYEDRNVQIGLACGLSGRAQIGKGMWAAPDRMAQMLEEKRGHPLSGANTAWVPNPTAATLHAVHYHAINVAERQQERSAEPVTDVSELLQIPLAVSPSWTAQEIAEELENNAQGLLGYVVRWVDQGVGCSKVPDINDIGLMEDRATLRISSQHLANWLLHGVVSWEQVEAALIKMAAKVDEQNAGDPAYTPLLSNAAGGIAMEAARALIRGGVAEPNGYTEPSLHRFRLQAKQAGLAAA